MTKIPRIVSNEFRRLIFNPIKLRYDALIFYIYLALLVTKSVNNHTICKIIIKKLVYIHLKVTKSVTYNTK